MAVKEQDFGKVNTEDFVERVVEVNRTSKKIEGGNRLRFSALVVVGDRKGKVGSALCKAPDVSSALRKAVKKAKKDLISVPLVGEEKTLPHEIQLKKKACKVLLKPAKAGTGVIAGGPVRAVLEAVGIENVVAKILGSRSKKGNVDATIEALRRIKDPREKVVNF